MQLNSRPEKILRLEPFTLPFTSVSPIPTKKGEETLMRYTFLIALAITAIAMTSMPAMARDHHHHWQNNGYRHNHNQYYNNYNSNPYPNGVRARNGSWVDGTIDRHGNPAWPAERESAK